MSVLAPPEVLAESIGGASTRQISAARGGTPSYATIRTQIAAERAEYISRIERELYRGAEASRNGETPTWPWIDFKHPKNARTEQELGPDYQRAARLYAWTVARLLERGVPAITSRLLKPYGSRWFISVPDDWKP